MIMMNFASERLMLAAQCVAIAELAYRESINYARERNAFGKPLTGLPGHASQARRHGERGSRRRARSTGESRIARRWSGEMVAGLAAMAKNVATDMCSFVCDQAVQIHGGYGYMRETLVERLYRDARLYPIGGGTREIMNEVIAKTEGY